MQCTDGCTAHNKSKGPFSDIAYSLVDLDSTLLKEFSLALSMARGHLMATASSSNTTVAAGGAVIASDKDLFDNYNNLT